MYKYHVYEQLKAKQRADKSFHMPGHKGRGDFKAKFPVAPYDVTELSYTDTLSSPSGVIAQAQKDIAEILGAEHSYITTDGSSSGVLALIYAAAKAGGKLIVPRGSHQSVYNACRLFSLEPVIVQGGYKDGVMQPPPPELIESLLASDVTIVGMIATSPDYYGNISPLKEYSEVLKRHQRRLLVDGAHGAHLAFEPSRRGYAGVYADAWVDGAHKTLPALTQGAIVSVNNLSMRAAVEEGLSLFRTTSPSFPIMASVEYGVKYLKNNPAVIENAKAAVEAFKGKCPLPVYPSDDWAKLVIDFESSGISSRTAAEFLEKSGIYAELSDGRHVIFYLSPLICEGDLNKLLSALNALLKNKKIAKDYRPVRVLPEAGRTYSFLYALKARRELVPLTDAAGRMCACNAGVTPPCVPVIAAGEIVTEEGAEILLNAETTFGVEDGKIWVVAK